jgi:hypothetical protein
VGDKRSDRGADVVTAVADVVSLGSVSFRSPDTGEGGATRADGGGTSVLGLPSSPVGADIRERSISLRYVSSSTWHLFGSDSLSVQDGRDDRIDGERVVVLRIDDDHGALRVSDQDELGIGTARKGTLNVAQ